MRKLEARGAQQLLVAVAVQEHVDEALGNTADGNAPETGSPHVSVHMRTTSRGIRAGVLACAAALFAFAPAARAAAPEPCDGALLVKDAAGDAAYKQQGNVVFAAPANADITGLFFRVDGGKITANVVIADLTKTLPQGFSAIRYRVYATVGGKVRYLQALLTSSGVAYSYGSQLQAVYTKEGDTTGAFFEGKSGVVQIVLPEAAFGKPGTKLEAVSASNGLMTSGSVPEEGQLPPVYFGVDTAPDGTSTVAVTPPICPEVVEPGPEVPPAEAPAPPPAPAAPASPAPAAPLGAPFQARGDLELSLAKSTLSARKVKRRLRLSLRSSERLTWVTVKLMRGDRVLSRLDLDVIGSRTTLKLRLGRALARRAHTLRVSGTQPDGTMAVQRLKLRVKR